MTEAKMTPSPPCFGAKIFDFRTSTVQILTPKNTLLHFENVAVFCINKAWTCSRIVLKLSIFEHMLHIEKIAWQRRKLEKFLHSNFAIEASWFPEIAALAVLISGMEKYTLHINCLKPNRLWSARFLREIAQVSVLLFSAQNVLSIYPRLLRKYFNFC